MVSRHRLNGFTVSQRTSSVTSYQEEIIKVQPVVNKKKDGSFRVRYRVIVAIGDGSGNFGMGEKVKGDEEAAASGATSKAISKKFHVFRRCWGYANIEIVPFKVRGKSGHIRVTPRPAPEGLGIQDSSGLGIQPSPLSKKLLTLVGLRDCMV